MVKHKALGVEAEGSLPPQWRRRVGREEEEVDPYRLGGSAAGRQGRGGERIDALGAGLHEPELVSWGSQDVADG